MVLKMYHESSKEISYEKFVLNFDVIVPEIFSLCKKILHEAYPICFLA